MAPDSIPRLPLRVRAHADESLPGLIVRMAEENLLATPYRLLEACGLGRATMTSVAADPAAIVPLARLMGLPEEDLRRLSYAAADGSVRLLGHPVPGDFVTADRVRICPLCLAEAPYHRAIWGLTVLTVCPAHGVPLADRCPDCGLRLDWRRRTMAACRCGAVLGRAASAPGPVPDAAAAACRLLHTPPDALAGLARDIGVGGVLRLLHALGCIGLNIPLRRPLALADADPELAARVVDEGWRALADWPASFHGFLDRLRADAPRRRGRYGLAKQFGRLPAWLNALAEHAVARAVRESLAAYLSGIPEIPTRARDVRTRRPAEADAACVTLSDACRLLGTSHRRLRPVAARHGLLVAGSGGQGEPLLLRRSSVRTLAGELAGIADRRRARAILGIGRRAFADIEHAGLLPSPAAGIAADLHGRACWPVVALETFVARVRSTATRAARANGPVVPLAAAARMISGLGLGSGTILAAVLDGRLRPVRLSNRGNGLAALGFPVAAVEALGVALGAEARATLSLTAAAAELAVKPEVVYQWARRGILPTVAVPGQRAERGRRVRRADLEAFRRNYATASELRGRPGMSPSRKLALELIGRGVVPVTGPSVDGARQYLFRRADLEALQRLG